MLNLSFLEKYRRESVRYFFTKIVHVLSNVAGKWGKNQLNKEMMATIKVATFKMYPLTVSEDENSLEPVY